MAIERGTGQFCLTTTRFESTSYPHFVNPHENTGSFGQILFSSEGKKIFGNNPLLLKKINRGIEFFREAEARNSNFITDTGRGLNIDLGDDVRMKYRWPGGLSLLFLLEMSGYDPVVVKMRKIPRETGKPHPLTQSFIKEVTQIKHMEADIGGQLRALGITMRLFYFATDMIVCYPFIDGPIANNEDEVFNKKIDTLEDIVDPYIQRKKKENPSLWKGVEVDLYGFRDHPRNENFLRINGRSYDALVWIDPFIVVD